MIHPMTVPLRRNRGWRLVPDARPLPQPFRWPLRRLGDRDPLVLAEHEDDPRRGVDLGYDARPFDRELYVPVFAAQDGDVMFAGETESGFAISIDHRAHGWATHYAHLSRLFVTPRDLQKNRKRQQRVRTGDVIGYAAKSPIEIRFELWQWTDDHGFVAVDPIAQFGAWATPLAHAPSIPDKQAA